jgi:hypothetical protein
MKFKVSMVVAACILMAVPVMAQGPPPASGPIVVRGDFNGADYDWWYYYTDWKRGYVAFHGVDIVSWCAYNPTGYSDWYYLDVFPPAEADLIHEVLKGDDITTSVWPVAIWEYTNACDYILNYPPIATGTADVIVTDNDVTAWRNTHNRKNAYHLSAHGVLYAPDGEGMVFSGGFHGVWHPEWDKEIWKTKIVLN